MKHNLKKLLSKTLCTASFLTFSMVSQNAFAATTPYVEWQNVFSGVDAVSRHIESTSDGGSILCGSGTVNGTSGLYVSKLDSSGNKTWETTLPVNGVGNSIQETTDNSYITISNNGHVIKLDSNGAILWDKTLPDASELTSLEPTKDGNFTICGSSKTLYSTKKYDVYLSKIDVNGNVIFSNSYGTTTNDFGQSVQQTVDGGYIILGTTMPTTPSFTTYMYLVKVDRNGNLLWGKSVGASNGQAKDLKVTKDGSFILAGYINYKGALLKTNSSGALTWSKILNDWSIDSVELDTDGFMLTGTVTGSAYPSDYDLQVMKTDLSGNKVWDYETTEYNSREVSRSITKSLDGGFLITGDTSADKGYGTSNITLMKVNY